jgi:hypothetical protein
MLIFALIATVISSFEPLSYRVVLLQGSNHAASLLAHLFFLSTNTILDPGSFLEIVNTLLSSQESIDPHDFHTILRASGLMLLLLSTANYYQPPQRVRLAFRSAGLPERSLTPLNLPIGFGDNLTHLVVNVNAYGQSTVDIKQLPFPRLTL